MLNGEDCGLKGFEFQVVDPKASLNATKPDHTLIGKTLQQMGYKVSSIIANNHWEVI